jgi:hypothetical protein
MNTNRTLKQFLRVALSMGALVATMSAAPEAQAVTWGPSTGPSGNAFWTDVAVDGQIWTASRVARFLTYAASNNHHRGAYYVECVNQPLYGWPSWGTTWFGQGRNTGVRRNEYWCPNNASLSVSYGWVDDNTYQ